MDSTFQAKDCNASFSQIFEEKTFGNLSPKEVSLFCKTCNSLSKSPIFLYLQQEQQEQLFQTTLINTLIKSSCGTFDVSGTIKWKGEAHVSSESTKKQVRDATRTHSTGSIPMGEHITSVNEGEFYTFTECRLRQYYGKCLTTTQLKSTVSVAEKQDSSKAVQQDVQTWICCPGILNIAVNPFLMCSNEHRT